MLSKSRTICLLTMKLYLGTPTLPYYLCSWIFLKAPSRMKEKTHQMGVSKVNLNSAFEELMLNVAWEAGFSVNS